MKYRELNYRRYLPKEESPDSTGSPREQGQHIPNRQGASQQLVREVAVGINYNGLNYAVMMASPEDLEDFALGFSLTSRVIERREQILDIELVEADEGVLVEITLNQRALSQFRHQRRTLAGTSGCGLCGVEALSQALSFDAARSERFSRDMFSSLPPAEHFTDLRARFDAAQKHRQLRGAMHCALYVDESGETRLCREDIGRHNALDKLIGACIAEGLDLRRGYVAVTSRCSLELIQKSVRAGIGTLISLSSPSDISVRWAQRYGINLLHQPAADVARIYSDAELALDSSTSEIHSIRDSQ
ncbi:formate dehydrogenase accessory sulfurtransferase FdhD [Microbulbifer pacificus]|uniref:Sulfur carrier protein FdhD n=1 Tax=Microbulbifer pacificus TaxID=407164 RepID=A0AAU0N144_9GAMM|nr:formate dehydrogenase accessory sulfurtransferase FdhD [Microbulbifer pacificus]WOX05676.1 formate dehydrogenase accessory sulfurtransferase FdhD [Microbulbifer pacificus]